MTGREHVDPLTGAYPDLPYRVPGEPIPVHPPTLEGLALFARLRAAMAPDAGADRWTDEDRHDKTDNDD